MFRAERSTRLPRIETSVQEIVQESPTRSASPEIALPAGMTRPEFGNRSVVVRPLTSIRRRPANCADLMATGIAVPRGMVKGLLSEAEMSF